MTATEYLALKERARRAEAKQANYCEVDPFAYRPRNIKVKKSCCEKFRRGKRCKSCPGRFMSVFD